MAIYAQFDEAGDSIQVASNQGWSDFGKWVETVPAAPHLRKLWEDAFCEDIPKLRAELQEELAEREPADPDVAAVAHQVIHAIDAAGQADLLLITNGITTGQSAGKKKAA